MSFIKNFDIKFHEVEQKMREAKKSPSKDLIKLII